MKARIIITPRQGVLDPQGAVVEQSLTNLGFEGASDVRVGRYIELELDDGIAESDARAQVDEMCRRFLANPVVEDYQFELEG